MKRGDRPSIIATIIPAELESLYQKMPKTAVRMCLTPHRLSKVTWELVHRGATGAQPRERNCGEPTPQYSSKVSTFLTFHDSNPAGHQIAAWIGAHHYALKHCLSDKHCPSKPAVNLPLGHYH